MEKNYNPEQKNARAMKQQTKIAKTKLEVPKKEKKIENKIYEDKKQENKIVEEKKLENKITDDKTAETKIQEEKKNAIEKPEIKTQEKETKKIEIKKSVKKDLAEVNAKDLKLSTKYAINLCRFVKFKTPDRAVEDLEKVLKKTKPVPMKGEYPHQKGKGIAGAKFPQNATKVFIMLIKSLKSNSEVNGINNPVISQAIANQASMPRGRFGKWLRKRTHVRLVAIEKNKLKNRKGKRKK